MPLPSLRRFFVTFLLTAVTALAAGPELGLQSWTCRNMSFEQMVDFAAQHGIKRVQLAGKHFNVTDPLAENLRKKALMESRGLELYSFGVVIPTADAAANRRIFELARALGVKLVAVEPRDPAAWDSLELLVKEFDIRLAIHNHGADTAYGRPEKVQAVLDHRDRRIGVCLDVGHLTEAGYDAEKVFRSYGDRVYDIHLKDKRVETAADGKRVAIDTVVGEGDSNYRGLFAAIKETGWSGVMAVETDGKDFAGSPGSLVDKAIVFFNANIHPAALAAP